MENSLLSFIGLFRKAYESAGVNFEQFIAILKVKLMMDNRRNSAMFIQGKHQKESEPSNRFVLALGLYAFLGAVVSIYIVINPSIGIIITHSFILALLALAFIGDYSNVLLDVTDNSILLPRPVSSKTLLAARLTHIVLYLGLMTLAMAVVPIIVVIFKMGIIQGFIFFITVILTGLFAVFITSLIYLALFKYLNGERLKDMVNYFQIGMAIFFYAFVQLFPRIFDFTDFSNTGTGLTPQWWHYITPPLIMTAPLDAFNTGNIDAYHIILTLESIVLPIAGLWLIIRYLAPFFSAKLADFATDTEGGKLEKKSQNTPSSASSIVSRLADFMTQSSNENAIFRLTWFQLNRDRKLKLRLYPQMAYSLVAVIIMSLAFFEKGHSFWKAIEGLQETRFFIMYIYLMSSMTFTGIMLIPFSDDYKAAWVYYALPIQKPGDILLGSIKAILGRFTILFYLMASCVVWAIWGIAVTDDLIFGLLNIIICSLYMLQEGNILYPFSEAITAQSDSGNSAKGLIIMLGLMLLGFLHWGLTYIPYVIMGAIPIQILILRYQIKAIRNIPAWRISTWRD